MAVCMHFDDLWKIASPVGVVNGFDLSPFDEISQVNILIKRNLFD